MIDVDSTEKTAYGKQQGVTKGYNPFRKAKHLIIRLSLFCAETKEILQGWLRNGNAYISNGVVEFSKQLLAYLPKSQTILFRGDSGFFNGKLFDLLDRFGQGYLVKVKLKGLKELLYAQAWKAIPDQPGWEQCTFWHQCGNWAGARRFVTVRQEKKREKKAGNGELFELKQYDFFCYVITEELSCWQIHKPPAKHE